MFSIRSQAIKEYKFLGTVVVYFQLLINHKKITCESQDGNSTQEHLLLQLISLHSSDCTILKFCVMR